MNTISNLRDNDRKSIKAAVDTVIYWYELNPVHEKELTELVTHFLVDKGYVVTDDLVRPKEVPDDG